MARSGGQEVLYSGSQIHNEWLFYSCVETNSAAVSVQVVEMAEMSEAVLYIVGDDADMVSEMQSAVLSKVPVSVITLLVTNLLEVAQVLGSVWHKGFVLLLAGRREVEDIMAPMPRKRPRRQRPWS